MGLAVLTYAQDHDGCFPAYWEAQYYLGTEMIYPCAKNSQIVTQIAGVRIPTLGEARALSPGEPVPSAVES